MKTLKYLLFAVLALSISMACSEDVVSGTDISDDETGLTGTKWQLAAFIDVQTRESIEPEPKDCNRCYTLEFDSDTTATGKSALNTLHFIVTPSTIEMFLMTEIGDSHYGNVDLYYEALQTLDTYECNKDELKIYYAEKKKYLLFKPWLEVDPPSVLPVADFSIPSGCVSYLKMQHDSVYVINSEEEWANLFTCESNPQIDFATQTLLVAFGGTTNGIANISKELLFENNTYSLTVDITLDMTAVAQGWHIVLVTDKINTQSVVLNLKKHYGDGSPACLWEQITPVTPSNEQKNRLDNVFSGNKKLLESIESDTLIVINNKADMIKLQGFSEYPDLWMEFDWDNQCIIGGKIITPSVSDEILSQQLLECLDTSSYKYEIEVKKCTACWTALGKYYFWAIYAKKLNTENVSLTIKTVE